MNFDRFKLMRSAARVIRSHVMSTHHQQTVGEHTFGVLAILMEIEPEPSLNLVRAVLYHDAPEALTGDVPAPTKWRFDKLREALEYVEKRIEVDHDMVVQLSAHERYLLSFCDLMEYACYASEEVDMGNLAKVSAVHRALASLKRRGLQNVTPLATELYEFIARRTAEHYPQDLGNDRLAGWTGNTDGRG